MVATMDVRHQESLRVTEDPFRALFEQNLAVKLIYDPSDGSILEANLAAAEFYGWTQEALRQKRIQDLDTGPAESTLLKLNRVRPEREKPFLANHRLASGEVRTVEIFASPIPWKGRACIVAILHDVTRQKQDEEALRETEVRFNLITGGLKDYILILDRDGHITFINHTPNGIPLSQAVGQHFAQSLPEEQAALARAIFQECIRNGRHARYEAPGTRLNGASGHFEIHIEPILLDGEVERVVLLAIDRTDARMVAEAEAQALKAESLVLMASSIAHDFNNIFQALLVSMDIVEMLSPGRAQVLQTLGSAKEALNHAVNLSWKMLDFSGRANIRLKEVRLQALITNWAPEWTRMFRAGELIIETGEHPPVNVDPDKLRKVLDHLLENAREARREAGHEEGQVRVRIYRDPEDLPLETTSPTDWTVLPPRAHAMLCLEVANDGPALSAEVLARMFDPFFSTKALGRGLGLPAALGILQAHGAGVQVQPGACGGLCFRIHFPLLEGLPAGLI